MRVHQHCDLVPIRVLAGSSYHDPHSLMLHRCRSCTHRVSEYILSSNDYKCMYYIHLYPNLEITEIYSMVDLLSSELSKIWNCEWSTGNYNRCKMLVFTWGHEDDSDIHCPGRPGAILLLVKSHPVEVHNQFTQPHNDIRWFQICFAQF